VRLLEVRGTDYDYAQAVAAPVFDVREGSSWTNAERCAEGDEGIDVDLASQLKAVYHSCYELQQKIRLQRPGDDEDEVGVDSRRNGQRRGVNTSSCARVCVSSSLSRVCL